VKEVPEKGGKKDLHPLLTKKEEKKLLNGLAKEKEEHI